MSDTRIAELEEERLLVRSAMTRMAEAGQSYSSPDGNSRDYGNYDGFRRRLKDIDNELSILRGTGFVAQSFAFSGRR